MNVTAKNKKFEKSGAKTQLPKDLRRHVCSLTVLAYQYQSPLPHLLSPQLADLSDLFLGFGNEIRTGITLLTQRIIELEGKPVGRVKEIEEGSYLPLSVGGQLTLDEVLRKQERSEHRLGQMLGHTARLARKLADTATSKLLTDLLTESEARRKALATANF